MRSVKFAKEKRYWSIQRIDNLGIIKMTNDATKWNNGCKEDKTRNLFIIPLLTKILTYFKPLKISDVGTGTAYIAREVDKRLQYSAVWTVIDIQEDRLKFAVSQKPRNMKMQTQKVSFLEVSDVGLKFDAIIFIFTLLEMDINKKFFSQIATLLNDDGIACITIPDSLKDIYDSDTAALSLLGNYLDNKCVLDKIDKFTEKKYPFKAHRFEHIVESMIQVGLDLVYMKIEYETFLLVFKKSGNQDGYK